MDTQAVCVAAGVIGDAEIRPDGTAAVTKGSRRLVFGPSVMDANGRAIEPDGWDAYRYERGDDPAGGACWYPAGSEYLPSDAEMIMLASWYA